MKKVKFFFQACLITAGIFAAIFAIPLLMGLGTILLVGAIVYYVLHEWDNDSSEDDTD